MAGQSEVGFAERSLQRPKSIQASNRLGGSRGEKLADQLTVEIQRPEKLLLVFRPPAPP